VRAVERTISWLAWLGMVLWVTGLLPAVLDEMDDIQWKVGTHPISLRNVIEGTLSAGFVLVVALWISAALEARLLAGAVGAQLSLRKVAANALRAALLSIGLLLALSAVGIDLTALSVLGGALGVGIGLGLQKLAANYVSGFVILAERALRIGDMVKVADFEGIITDITTRYTVIRAPSGREAIVPNETLITTTVQTLSLADRNVLLSTVVGVDYDTDVACVAGRGDAVGAARADRTCAGGPSDRVCRRRAGADALLLDHRSRARPGQCACRGEPCGAGAAEARGCGPAPSSAGGAGCGHGSGRPCRASGRAGDTQGALSGICTPARPAPGCRSGGTGAIRCRCRRGRAGW
jgi:Mechanosensitive ion channel